MTLINRRNSLPIGFSEQEGMEGSTVYFATPYVRYRPEEGMIIEEDFDDEEYQNYENDEYESEESE